LNTLYLQTVRGLSPLHAGLYLLPMAVMIAIFSPISGRILGGRGARVPLVLAAVAITAAAVMLTRLTATTSFAYLVVSYVLFGIGAGLVNPPITNTAMTGMPAAQAGVAGAVASTSRQVGMTLGVAVIGAVSAGAIAGALVTGPSRPDAPLVPEDVVRVVLGQTSAAVVRCRRSRRDRDAGVSSDLEAWARRLERRGIARALHEDHARSSARTRRRGGPQGFGCLGALGVDHGLHRTTGSPVTDQCAVRAV
jgi:hypothetical protein